jgi:hypothetical protein
MPMIMCTKELWKRLGSPSPLLAREECDLADTRLGAWSAKCVRFPEGDLVVAVNEITYLAIVFPLAPLPDFLLGFGHAVGSLLDGLGYETDLVRAEAEPFLFRTVFAKNSNRSLVGTLNDLCIHVDAALEAEKQVDRDALLRIQLRLSEIPHVHRDSAFPRDAAALLFASGGRA